VRPMRARTLPIPHSLFNAARDALVFACDLLHCTLRSGIVDLPGFDANFLSVKPPKSGSSRNVPINLAPTFQRITIPTKAAKHAARCGGHDTTRNEKPRRCRTGQSHEGRKTDRRASLSRRDTSAMTDAWVTAISRPLTSRAAGAAGRLKLTKTSRHTVQSSPAGPQH
jgi:hypothetical protein